MGKSCGECGMCCKLLAIQSLDKPAGAWCGHFKRAAGCGVYDERPPACRSFVCLWLDSEKLDEAWRPDRAKFLMYTEKDGQRLNVIVDPNQPGAWKREPYYRRLKAMSELALEGRELVVCIGDRRIVVFPHEDVDLGLVDPKHKLVSGYAERDGMMVPYAMILSDVDAS
ncbi:MAG: YkgJ family cysteine cluster protein [Phenylobacterium sp.]|nr:YkgJ family cysteine cluster protein [Phenylobacterium sp.]